MARYPVSTLKDKSYFDAPVYLGEDYILLSPDTPVTEELVKRLKEWNFMDVNCDGKEVSKPAAFAAVSDEVSLGAATIDQDINHEHQMQETASLYLRLVSYTEQVFKNYASNNVLDFNDISERVKNIIEPLRNNRDLMLSFPNLPQTVDNYLINHTVNCTLLSLAMGMFLKLPPHKLIELGISAFFHDIGMVKIPKEIYLNPNPLSPQAQKTIMAHTLLGYRILKSVSATENIALGVSEHQERFDGSGYPKRLKGEAITQYATIIAVACSFDAIVSKRPHKKSRNGHTAILDLLKINRKAYDENVLKALVYCLALYPLGMHVMLSNNTKGIVTRTNPKNPKYPIVRILQDQNGNKIADSMLVQTSPEQNLEIVRALTREEMAQL